MLVMIVSGRWYRNKREKARDPSAQSAAPVAIVTGGNRGIGVFVHQPSCCFLPLFVGLYLASVHIYLALDPWSCLALKLSCLDHTLTLELTRK
jgi:hypothetical protein